jgi:hypothetical protein
VRSLEQSVVIDGVRVTLAVDRAVIFTGDPVTATLRAYGETRKKITVDLTAFDSHNYEGARVEQPSVAIDHERIVLDAAPNGGPTVSTKIVMGKRPERLALVDYFRIFVSAHGLAPNPDNEGDDESRTPAAAAVSVLGWSGNSFAISMRPETSVREGESFVIAVRAKNTSGKTLPTPYLRLGTQVATYGGIVAGENVHIEEIEENRGDEQWQPGAIATQRFTVKLPKIGAKRIALVAEGFAGQGIGPVAGGAMDVQTFAIDPETKPAVAVK